MSLSLQAKILSQKLETHLLGNHLFANGKALLFAGLFFDGEADHWLSKSLRIFDREIDEQILNDGGNFELTPMYHAIMVADLLDIISLIETYKDPRCLTLNLKCRELAPKMLRWLSYMSHLDGDISFFNDSAIGIAPNLEQISLVLRSLGLANQLIQKPNCSISGFRLLPT